MSERREVLTYTDDTHMMIGVAESLIRARGFDGEDGYRSGAEADTNERGEEDLS